MKEIPFVSKKSGGNKVSEKTIHVKHTENTMDMYKQIMSMKNDYLYHRYQIVNDRFEWKSILHTTREYGMIFHLDFSENITGTPKLEPHSAHFNKNQYSLHCTVGHHINEEDEIVNAFYYHLSDDNIHDWSFTGRVIDDLISHGRDDDLIWLKSDNCGYQYKNRNVFICT